MAGVHPHRRVILFPTTRQPDNPSLPPFPISRIPCYHTGMEQAQRYQNKFFFILLGIALILIFFIVRPFVNSLILAIAFAVVLHPLFLRIKKFLRGHESLSAVFTLLIAAVIVLIPLSLVVSRVFSESQRAYQNLGSDLRHFDTLITQIQEPIQRIIPTFQLDIAPYIGTSLQMLAQNAGSILTTTLSTLLQTFLFIVTLFFLTKNGDRVKQWLIEISPLRNTYDELIIRRMTATINSVVRGTLLVAIIQGTAAGIGYAAFGLPNPTLWGLVTAVAALIPGVGTSLILVPAIAYQFFSGNLVGTVGLAIWGAGFVGLIDNVLGPKILSMGKGVDIHPFLILISVLGGLSFFGIWGFILGPIALSFLLSLLDVYKQCILHEMEGGKIPDECVIPTQKTTRASLFRRRPKKQETGE